MIMKKQYIIPMCEVTVLSSGSLMKYTGPASLPDHVGAPARHLGGSKSEVF